MALRNQPYIPLYVQDYLTDEKLNMCSLKSQGVYVKIMCVLHKQKEYGTLLLKQKDKQNESKCLNFAFKLARLLPIAMFDLSEAISELVDEDVLQIAGDELQQKRMIKDNALSLIRAKAGSKGGKKRSFAIAKTQANTEDESEDESESEFAVDKYNEGFDAFWNLYPKKQGKGACKKIWKKIKVSGELLKNILAAVECQKQSNQWTKDGGQFIPMPSTWLNQERWDDEISDIGFVGQDRYLNVMITEEDLHGFERNK